MDIRKIIYEKLSADTDLIKLLPDKCIYTAVSENAGTYPVVVLSIIDDVPSLHADDLEINSDIRFQLTIITDDGEYDAIEQLIKNDMTEINATRKITTDIKEDNRYNHVLQYVISNSYN